MNSLSRLMWLAVWFGLAIYLALTLWLGVSGLGYPYQLDYGEGIVLWFAQQLAHGQAIYKGLTEFPYASSNYPPVAMLLSAALMPVFGDGYIGGRLLNLASALIVVALIFRIVQVETRNRNAAALAASFFLGSPYIYHWVPLFRVDLIGLAFAFGGIFLAWKIESTADGQQSIRHFEEAVFPDTCVPAMASVPTREASRFRRRRFLASLEMTRMLGAIYYLPITVLFLLALYTKQTLFAAPAAVFFALAMRNRKHAIAFAALLGLSGGALYLLIDYATRGGFTFGLLESNATVFRFEQLIDLLKNYALTFAIVLLLAVASWIERVRAKRWGVLEWYAIISIAALAMAGRTGAWENYFFEAIAIACVFLGFQIANYPIPITKFRFAFYVLPLLLLLQLALFWHDPRIAVDLMAQELPANQQLAKLLKQTSGIVISEDMGALATSGKEVAYYTFQYSSLARSGKWNQQWELNGLRDGTFPLVILERGTREDVDHYRRFTREFVSALDRYYARTQTIGKYEIYTPASGLQLQSANFGDAVTLVGYNVAMKPSQVQVTIVWQAQRALDRRYTAFVHLENSTGGKIAQDDHEPRGGNYPTTRWAASEMVRESYTLNVANDLPPGRYVLKVGWYDTDMGDRLSVPNSADDSFTVTLWENSN